MEKNLKYLIDTNVWLELLLDQEKSEIVSRFFDNVPIDQLFVSDFAIHSIGVILSRFKKFDVLSKFIEDLFVNGQIEQLSLDYSDLLALVDNMQRMNLDFDDSYQYTIAQKYDLTIITFDKDFDAKGIKKITPEEILKSQ